MEQQSHRSPEFSAQGGSRKGLTKGRWVLLGLLLATTLGLVWGDWVVRRAAANRPPRIFLFVDSNDPGSSSALYRALASLKCQVDPLPLRESPRSSPADMILFGPGASGTAAYRAYQGAYAGELIEYVARGGLLVQLGQEASIEPYPPFLTETMEAYRRGPEVSRAFVMAENHPLLSGVTAESLSALAASGAVTRAFSQPRGFQVLASADPLGQYPILMEAALGRGRVLLSALPVDDALAPLFANLVADADAQRRGDRRGVWPTTTSDLYQPRTDDSWTLALLPDTQKYARHFPGILLGQCAWLAQHAEAFRLRYVLHLGDMTDTNRGEEWINVREAMGFLDGKTPYTVCAGNHDYGPDGDGSDRETLLNEMFPVAHFQDWPTFGGVMEAGKMENAFHRFSAGSQEWLVVVLEWAPRDEAVAWANRIMDQNPGRKGILVTHAYVDRDSTRMDHRLDSKLWDHHPHGSEMPGSINDGQELWEKLVVKHDFRLVFSGHILGQGTGYVKSQNRLGHTVHQMASNYQNRELGGEGYLRLLEFFADGRRIEVRTYSPILGRFLLGPTQAFEIELD